MSDQDPEPTRAQRDTLDRLAEEYDSVAVDQVDGGVLKVTLWARRQVMGVATIYRNGGSER